MKVFFISYGTGGAEIFNTIYPLFQQTNKGFKVANITISTYAKNKNPNSLYISEEDIITYLTDEKPDIIINETSNGLHIQNKISKLCKNLKILNISVLDFFGNYEDRFLFPPDKVIVPSKSTFIDLCRHGFSEDDLYICGNPSFDRFENYIYNKEMNYEKPHILYASQGFDKFYVFKDFYTLLEKHFTSFNIDIKIHPQESSEMWDLVLKDHPYAKVLNFDNRNDFLSECLKYDLIIGYNSTLQIQSYLMGIPVIFHELNQIEKSLLNFREKVLPIEKHPYGDFEKNATYNTINTINSIIKAYA